MGEFLYLPPGARADRILRRHFQPRLKKPRPPREIVDDEPLSIPIDRAVFVESRFDRMLKRVWYSAWWAESGKPDKFGPYGGSINEDEAIQQLLRAARRWDVRRAAWLAEQGRPH